ncbi:MAG: hypothetical protein C0621_00905 [Desulfuromonas sp.]|nr:MAG: hypothetical protein C0621_00905 [Desulfuromonas sp.]
MQEGVRARKKRETRQAIIDAAIRLFGEKGFEATSIDELARAAGIGKGTIYGYFRTKLEIFFAFCEEQIDYSFSAVSTTHNSDAPLLEQLHTLFFSQFRFITANAEFGRQLVRELTFPSEANRNLSRDLDRRYLKTVQDILIAGKARGELHPDCDPLLATVHFYALYLLLISGWYSGYSTTHEDQSQALRALLQQALAGLGNGTLTQPLPPAVLEPIRALVATP